MSGLLEGVVGWVFFEWSKEAELAVILWFSAGPGITAMTLRQSSAIRFSICAMEEESRGLCR